MTIRFPHVVVVALVALPALAAAQPPNTPAQAAGQGQAPRDLRAGAPDTAFAVVHLREDQSGACVPIHKTDTVRVSRSRKAFFELVVVNDCATMVYVSVTDFAHYTNPGAGDPIETPTADRRRPAQANSVSNNLRLRVRSTATLGRWNYNLRINDALIDPKLDIEQ